MSIVMSVNAGSSSLKFQVFKMPEEEVLAQETGVINDMSEVKAVGHRVVHGGEYFSHSVPVDADVEAKVEELCALAPLHNPAALVGYRSFRDALPECKHTFVFDTAFHQSMPEENYIFPLPYEYY